MTDCLIIVERNVSKPDIIHQMLQQTMEGFFKGLVQSGYELGHELLKPPLSYLANYGMAGTISLTSVVLATSLQEAGMDCMVLDDDDVLETYRNQLESLVAEARVIALSTTYIVMRRSLRQIVQTIRRINPDVPLLLGGQGIPSLALDPFSPEDAEIFDQVDALMYGEAEYVFAELVRDFRDGVSGRRNLPGVLYRRGGIWEGNTTRVDVDLDRTPIPDYRVLDRFEFNLGRLGDSLRPSAGALEEGRGCRFRCRFCSYHMYSPFRRKSPERIVAEMRALKDLGYKSAAFVGAEFLTPPSHSSRVLAAMADARLDMNSWIYGRLDHLAKSPGLLDALVKANVSNVVFGMESGDPGILKLMGKYYNVDKMVAGAREAREKGVELSSSVIIGYPGETDETVSNTIRVLVKSEFNYVFLHALNVVPQTPLWRNREQLGLKVGKTGYWAHTTMSLHQVPEKIKGIIKVVNRECDSLFVNVKRNIAAPFLKPGETDRLDGITKLLQDVLTNEWSGQPSEKERIRLWRSLHEKASQVPKYAADILSTIRPGEIAGSDRPLYLGGNNGAIKEQGTESGFGHRTHSGQESVPEKGGQSPHRSCG